ncbi:MAG: AmpG family muropeptide MFS transporter [Bdellovibrionota bacterium]
MTDKVSPDRFRVLAEFSSAFKSKAMAAALLMGFASGFPLLLTTSTLKVWLTESGINLSTIGFFALLGIPYTFKFLWSPFLDHYIPPFLGRRRGWLLITQTALVVGIALIGTFSPNNSLYLIAAFAFWITFFGASQDILIDAYRRESLSDRQLGLGSSLYVYGYRFAILVTRTSPLLIAEYYSWTMAYFAMAGLMAINIFITLWSDEPEIADVESLSLKDSIVEPLKEFFTRNGIASASLILIFILLYKMGDSYASILTSPFYVQIGITKSQIAGIDGTVGFASQFLGLFIGGSLIVYLGINRSLWICGFLQMISTAGFSLLAGVGADLWLFAGVVAFENISSGMGTAAFVAYMAKLTDKRFTATQYALLTSLMAVPMRVLGATSGILAESTGWGWFFIICTLAAIPGLLLLPKVAPLTTDK